jgi:prevent-host-death family protein
MVMKTAPKTRIIPAGEFKAKCLALMDEVAETGTTLIVTKRGKPVAHLIAPPTQSKNPFVALRGLAKGGMTITGDIISPLDEDWEALKS